MVPLIPALTCRPPAEDNVMLALNPTVAVNGSVVGMASGDIIKYITPFDMWSIIEGSLME